MKILIPTRPYQNEAEEKWFGSVEAGRTRGMIVLPTGCGKTILGLNIAAKSGRTLWIADRDVLIDQPIGDVTTIFDGCEYGVLKAEQNDLHVRDIIFASIQTLSRPKRLEAFLASLEGRPLKLIVADEGHHSASPSWLRVLDHEQLKDVPQLALTATPFRSDQKGLAKIWGARPLYQMSLRQAIDGDGKNPGWLVPYRSERIYCDKLDLSKVPIDDDGDYQPDELEKEMVRANAALAVAEKVKEVLDRAPRKTILFATSVDQAQRISKNLHDLGVSSRAIWGELSREERGALLRQHKAGEFLVLCNCAILGEGYNDPSVSMIVMAAPTKSEGRYVQHVGRGFRTCPGKDECLILDLVGGDDPSQITAEYLDEDEREFDQTPKTKPRDGLQLLGERDGEFGLVKGFVKAATYGVEKPKPKRRARVHWLPVSSSVHALSAGEHGSLILLRESVDPDLWRGYRLPKDAWTRSEIIPIMRRPTSQELATGVVEDRARKLGVFGLNNEAARWRDSEPSEEQLKLVERLKTGKPAPTTKGEASDLISISKLQRLFGAT